MSHEVHKHPPPHLRVLEESSLDRRQRNGTLFGVLDSVSIVTVFVVSSGRWMRNQRMKGSSGPREGGVCVCVCVGEDGVVVFYGVCAMPRLDFIFSSLFERWLLLDSSSSTLSSADRSCRVKGGWGWGWGTVELKECFKKKKKKEAQLGTKVFGQSNDFFAIFVSMHSRDRFHSRGLKDFITWLS